MKKSKMCIFIISLLLLVAITGCSSSMGSSDGQQDDASTGAYVGVPEAVSDCYVGYLELAKTDRSSAVKKYCHFEDSESMELTASAPNLLDYEIISWQELADSLWEVRVKLVSELFPSGTYGAHYVGAINGSYYVMINTEHIPDELKNGVEITPVEPYGDEIVGPADITGPIS